VCKAVKVLSRIVEPWRKKEGILGTSAKSNHSRGKCILILFLIPFLLSIFSPLKLFSKLLNDSSTYEVKRFEI
jgi:hypothetical protein